MQHIIRYLHLQIQQLNDFRTKEQVYLEQINKSVQEQQYLYQEISKLQNDDSLQYFQQVIDEKDQQIKELHSELEIRTQQLEQIIQQQQEEIQSIKNELKLVKEQTVEYKKYRKSQSKSKEKQPLHDKLKDVTIDECQLEQLLKEFKSSQNSFKNISNQLISKYSSYPTERSFMPENQNQSQMQNPRFVRSIQKSKNSNSPDSSRIDSSKAFSDYGCLEQQGRKVEKPPRNGKVETPQDYGRNLKLQESPKCRIPSFSEIDGSYTNQSLDFQFSRQEITGKKQLNERSPSQLLQRKKLAEKQQAFLIELQQHEQIIMTKINIPFLQNIQSFGSSDTASEMLENLQEQLELIQKQKEVQEAKIRKLL